MRLVEVKGCEYELFSRYRDRLWDESDSMIGVFSAEYSKELKIARFWFWDSKYIPQWLERYVLEPPRPE